MSKTVLYIINSEKYFEGVVGILRSIRKEKRIIYVTTNKTFKHLTVFLESQGINFQNFFFIDGISASSGNKDLEAKNCIFLENPSNLTEMGIAISRAIENILEKKFCSWIL